MTAATPNTNNVANVFTLLSNARRLLLVNYLALFEYGRKVEVRHLRELSAVSRRKPLHDLLQQNTTNQPTTASFKLTYRNLTNRTLSSMTTELRL